MTRCTCRTVSGQLGTLELAEGVTHDEVVRAMREHRLFIVPETTLEATPPQPGGETVVAGGAARSSSSSSTRRKERRS